MSDTAEIISPKKLKSERKRAVIRNAATELFANAGYDRTTLKDIADSIGLTHAALYYYYGSKPDLLFDVVKTAIEETVALVEGVPAAPPEIRIVEIAKAQVSYQIKMHNFTPISDSALYGPLSKAKLFSDEQVDRLNALQRRLFLAYRGEIDVGCKSGVFSVKNLAATTFSVIGAVSYVVYWYRERGPLSQSEVADLIGNFCLSALLADKTAA